MAWEIIQTDELRLPIIRQLFDNEVAAIKVAHFVDSESCAEAVRVLAGAHSWAFYEGASPPLGRLGITQYEHFAAKDSYFRKARDELAARSALLAGLADPMDMLMRRLRGLSDHSVGIASESGVTYYAGIFRRGAASTIHSDWAPRDGRDWQIGKITAQLGWNLYYSMPASGGELVVYNFPWVPEIEQHARQRYNDYDPAVFKDVQRVTIGLRAGDLVLFNARNAHQVSQSPDADLRLSTGSFIGEMTNGDIVFWS